MKRPHPAFLLPLLLALLLPAATAQAQPKPGDDARYRVVINHEEQYSIWPADRETPMGWKAVGEPCKLDACHAYIEEVWTDMRPLSLRRHMDKMNMPADRARYQVVINHEEQYSLRLADQEVESPWRPTGEACSLKACRAYIEEVWTDMRPLSLRKELKEH